ncbi:MAG: excinuclease ABC subunit UvrC [Rhodoluna sp.]|nr:excinuclease ABC subunit UvrC [Rhodoluna sp.]
MNARKVWFPATATIPINPGVYRWFDAQDRVLYVGKAKNLRARLTSYFAKPETLHERTRRMVESATRIDWTLVNTEFEALQLEFTWIKEFHPPFNVQFRDDKSYPYLAISLGEEFPRVFTARTRVKGKTKYFGPYTQAWAIRETIDGLLKVFPIRSCSDSQFSGARATNRACLLADIGKCSAPCISKISADDHRLLVNQFAGFVNGTDTSHLKTLKEKMLQASNDENFEMAARYRDQQGALEAVAAKSAVVLDDSANADVFALELDGYSAAVSMFNVRKGRIRGARGWVVDLELERSAAEVMEYTLHNIYVLEGAEVPKEVIVTVAPADAPLLVELLSSLRGTAVRIRVPERGDKKSLADTAQINAANSLAQFKLKRATDFTARSVALASLQKSLGMTRLPLVIECFDVSHLAGTNIVASKVVFVDGKPKKDLYRRYNIATASDDTDAMNQVLKRRLALAVQEGDLPDLILVDGAKPQVSAAVAAAKSLGIEALPIVGIAKRLEEIWLPGDSFPVLLPRASEELFLIQHLRDESHRFAIAHQRLKRSASISTQLEEVAGLGQKRARILLKTFGSAKRVKLATEQELGDVPGIGPALAKAIYVTLRK